MSELEDKIVNKAKEIAGSGNTRAFTFLINLSVSMLAKGESHTNVLLFLETHDKKLPNSIG